MINPLSPHEASKHNFTSMKINLFFLGPEVLKRKFLFSAESVLTIHGNFLYNLNHIKSSSSTTSRELRQQFALEWIKLHQLLKILAHFLGLPFDQPLASTMTSEEGGWGWVVVAAALP